MDKNYERKFANIYIPLINAVFIGIGITENKPDGIYIRSGNDADQTYSGKPVMSCNA